MDPTTENQNAEINLLDLPDDQVMAMSGPPVNAAPATEVVETVGDAGAAVVAEAGDSSTPPPQGASATPEDRAAEATGSTPAAPAAEAGADGASAASVLAAADDATGTVPPAAAAAVKSEETAAAAAAAAAAKPAEGEAKPGDAAKAGDQGAAKPAEAAKVITPDDHKAFYDRLLGKPIKANGKEIQLQSPDEAEKLIQMGLNYTKKMQAMQPALRVVKMLENNGLMDEGKLSHLIDISKGDSAAIQKLLADKGFDPLTADAEQAKTYVPADHRVTDLEMSFSAVLEEVEQTPTGAELISEVHGQWDADSKRALFQSPAILTKLAEHKAIGLYAQIDNEVSRLRALGQITPDIPFLQAYHAVGDMLAKTGRLVTKTPEVPAVETPAVPAVPVETRVAAPAPKVTNTTQAQATAPVRVTPSNPKPVIDYLSMDDAEFAKSMGPRV